MYKRKKRRANKGKKKLSIAATSSSPSATRTTDLSADELVQNGTTEETIDNMSVTTMEVAEGGNQQQQPQPQRPSDLTTTNNNSNNKAVGARKRKPMQISKIVDKLPLMNDHPIDFGAEKNLVHNNNNNNNNSPPYKKPCLELSKNGMIKNILSELKTAKMGGGNNKGDTPMTRRLYERDEDDDEEYEDDRSDEDETPTLRIKVDDDDDEEENGDGDGEEEDEGVDYSGNEEAKFVNNKRNNIYANCERHLRNRHGQIDREQLRDLVVCLPTSSNASESETEMNSNGTQQSYPVALVEPNKRRATGGGGGGGGVLAAEENDLPLDLSMDAVDLSLHSKHRDGGNPIFRRKASLPRPRPMYAANELSNSLVTSPFISKREPMVHPQLQLNTFTSHPIVPQAPVLGAPNHPAFSLFPFGAPPGFNPFVIPPANVEKLMSLNSSPPKISNQFIAASPKGSFENLGPREPISVEKESKVKVEPATESKRSNSKSASSSSVSPTTSSRKRADNNTNGEYQKPKQRRYRTERPYSCPFCPARFTLRSNMERHGKHQHPTVWVRSPSNRVINRQKNQQLSPLVGSPTLVQPKKYNSNNNNIGADSKEKNNKDSAVNVNVRAVIAQQLKRKLSNSSLRNNNNGSETETDPENTPAHDSKNSGGDTPDLASVSQLLDRVKNSNFAQYFNEAENHNFSNDNNNSDDELDGDDSGEEEGLSDERSADEGDSKTSSGGVEKKKSAYSSSPHKVSGEFINVFRRFLNS